MDATRPLSRLIFFDIETGGIDPKRHPIIQIAAVAVDDQLEVLEAFEAKLQFRAGAANRHSLRKNHYHPGVWARTAIPTRQAAADFASFLRRHASIPKVSASGASYDVAQLVAHNASFDSPFLSHWYERERMYLPASPLVLCTLQRALWYVQEQQPTPPPLDFKLATLCQHFGVPFAAAAAHEALGDVLATLGLYRALFEKCNFAKLTARRDRQAA